MALLDGRLGDRSRLELGQRLGRLAIERDLDDRRQPMAQRLGREQRNAALDDAGFDERLDAAQAGGGRGVDLLREGLVGERGVALEVVEDLEIDRVDD